MKLSEVKNIIKMAKAGQEIIIENNICGTFESITNKMGAKSRHFKPYTDQSFWSSWRVGIPYKWKGKSLVLWVKGYQNVSDKDIFWMCETIWSIKTNKELRKDASVNCWDHVRAKAKDKNINITDIKAKKINPEDVSKGWQVSHLGVDWIIEPNISFVDPSKSTGFWVKCPSSERRYASFKYTLKEAKAFIKYDSGEWLSNNIN